MGFPDYWTVEKLGLYQGSIQKRFGLDMVATEKKMFFSAT